MSERTVVSVVAPVFNESANLEEFVKRLSSVADDLREEYRFEFVLVDDGSTDASPEIARNLAADEPRLKVIELRRNYGQTAALQAGLDQAEGEILVSMDSDLQHFPEDIPRLLEPIRRGFDVVCGWRHARKEGIMRRWPSRIANWLTRLVSGLDIHDIGTTFRAYRADIIRDFRLLGEQHRFVPVFAATVGAQITEVKVQNVPRSAGRSNYGLSRTLNVLLDIFFLVFYVHYLDRPIRLFGKFALLALVGAVAITIGLIGKYLATGIVIGERAGLYILGLVLYVSAIQLLLFGILSELIVRMYFRGGTGSQYNIRRSFVRTPSEEG